MRNPEPTHVPIKNTTKYAYFSAIQLAPYVGWQDFLSWFLSGWEHTEKIIGHRKLKRIGLRYINRIDIPQESISLEDWITISPRFPGNLKEPTAAFMQLLLPYEEDQALLKAGTTDSPLPKHASILLDIDIGTTGEIKSHTRDRLEILERLHVEKNKIFEYCITDATRSLFK